ncbi:hypothetical protein [Paragemmobacter ruber]|uniref:Uncharacterized protein n=1 Tax=Paragemmobacter ruber TaxID=1985673 RepID=A0ABW9Y367_9RHOB|nr:hypothetical protein [Rhodobacter ruber]NBE06973.1 hypothetical protein [Rhodobacter ruber]
MPRPNLAPPDAAPLREALRGIRFLLRRGGATVADTLTLDALPDPAAGLAKRMIREVEGLARSVDEAASAAAKGVLGGHDNPAEKLDEIVGHSSAAAEFGRAIYTALDAVLRRIGVDDAFISEMSARAVFAAWRQDHPHGQPQDWAADLTLRLLAARVIRGAVPAGSGSIGRVEPVAVFAVLLWLQSDRSESENEAVLEAAADIALARATEIAATIGSGDQGRIAALYRKYVDHV